VNSGKARADCILAHVKNLLGRLLRDPSERAEAEASWEAKMDDLKSGRGFAPSRPWKPFPEAREDADVPTAAREPVRQVSQERWVRELVSSVVTEKWAVKDKERAQVGRNHPTCMSTPLTPHSPSQEVANAVYEGFKSREVSAADDKNKFAAVYARSDEDNLGLPFWIGKIADVDLQYEDQVEEDDDESGADPYPAVKIAEFNQETKPAEDGGELMTGKYIPHAAHGDVVRGSTRTKAVQQYTWVPMTQVAWIFDGLTAGKKIKQKDQSYIAHQCEVAWKTDYEYPSEGAVRAYNATLGFKTLPKPVRPV